MVPLISMYYYFPKVITPEGYTAVETLKFTPIVLYNSYNQSKNMVSKQEYF